VDLLLSSILFIHTTHSFDRYDSHENAARAIFFLHGSLLNGFVLRSAWAKDRGMSDSGSPMSIQPLMFSDSDSNSKHSSVDDCSTSQDCPSEFHKETSPTDTVANAANVSEST
jgi:RNA recognition motif-containing protein